MGHWLPNERVRRIVVGLICAASFALKASELCLSAMLASAYGYKYDMMMLAMILAPALAFLGVIAMIAIQCRDFAQRRDRSEQAAAHANNGERDSPISRLRKSFSILRAIPKRIVAAMAKFGISTLPRSCHSKCGADV